MQRVASGRQIVSLTDDEAERIVDWVKKWPDIPGIHALKALATAGRDVSEQLPRFLHSQDAAARECALTLCHDRTHLLSRGLADEDYSCRVAAIQAMGASASVNEITPILRLSDDRSCNVRVAITAQIGRSVWGQGIPTLVGMLTDTRDYAEQMDGDRHNYHVARTACSALRQFDPLPADVQMQLVSFLERCLESTRDTTVHGLLFRLLAEHPTEEFASFCTEYIAKTWLESAWQDNQGHALLSAALRAIIVSLEFAPSMTKHVAIREFAECDDDAAWLAAPALTALCLCGEVAVDDLTKIRAAHSFNTERAILKLTLVSSTAQTPPDALPEWISKNHPLNTILSWVSDDPMAASWDAFIQADKAVDEWLRSLVDGDEIALYTRWALGRLLRDVDHVGMLGELPREFRFPAIDHTNSSKSIGSSAALRTCEPV